MKEKIKVPKFFLKKLLDCKKNDKLIVERNSLIENKENSTKIKIIFKRRWGNMKVQRKTMKEGEKDKKRKTK